ncbi:uncharacterized protein LOC129712782 isoform X2 [Leucoraja erinacea]|uniref:uncharacterized protein LOC129712782 isoform X2 n=1 Tax=Leucoraja erinaceus TaxID=7782 RepID=UPI002454D7C9|nr:uncharacterized protein LOC129712782 isoform X2 [Leucoraja erinacea]
MGTHSPVYINRSMMERVKSFKFLGMHISEDLSWSENIDAIIKKTHQRLRFLRRLRRVALSRRTLSNFYRYTVESMLTSCIVAWFGNLSAQEWKRLQKVVNTAQSIIGSDLPSIEGIYRSSCLKKAGSIIKDPHHPGHTLISPLPSGRRYRSLKTAKTRWIYSELCEVAMANRPVGGIVHMYALSSQGRIHGRMTYKTSQD